MRRIDEALGRLGWSDERACREANLRVDFVRNLRRYPDRDIKVSKLTALARAIGVPPAYLVDENAEVLVDAPCVTLDREHLRLAQRAVRRALADEDLPDREEAETVLTADLYDLLTERARSGKPVDPDSIDDFIEMFIRRMVLDRFRPR